MKIGIILSHCHNYGSSRYVIETTKYFVKEGHEVHIFANSWDKIDSDMVSFHKVPQPFKNLFLRELFTTLIETVLLKFYKLDVTLSQPCRYFSPDVAEVQFVFKKGIERRKEVSPLFKLANKALSSIENYNLKKAKGIIAISKTVKEELVNYYKLPEDKIHVAYSGVNLNEFSPNNRKKFSREIRQKFNILPTDTLLVFVGNPFDRKGLKYAIGALARVDKSNVKLLVIGRDNPSPYIKIARDLGVKDRLIFKTDLTREIYKYFAASDIFLFPTLYEPFGLVILEAMASGLPVITSKSAGASELIDDRVDGLLLDRPDDMGDIAKKIEHLVHNKKARKKIGEMARKKAEKYSWERTAETMLSVLQKAAG